MFVRLFVDENLDRIVPISKQPKEKIQAIIDACARQFPEFAERTRKRIRTYLKSCRRNKRTRDSNGWETVSGRPTQAPEMVQTSGLGCNMTWGGGDFSGPGGDIREGARGGRLMEGSSQVQGEESGKLDGEENFGRFSGPGGEIGEVIRVRKTLGSSQNQGGRTREIVELSLQMIGKRR